MVATGGHITLEDLRSYTTLIDETPIVNDNLPGDLSLCGPPPPSSFAIVQSIIAIFAGDHIFLIARNRSYNLAYCYIHRVKNLLVVGYSS